MAAAKDNKSVPADSKAAPAPVPAASGEEDDTAGTGVKFEMRTAEDTLPPLPRVPTVELKPNEKTGGGGSTNASSAVTGPATASASGGAGTGSGGSGVASAPVPSNGTICTPGLPVAKLAPGQTHFEGWQLLTECDLYEMIQNTTPAVATATGETAASLAYPIPPNLKITPLDETGWNQVVNTPACSAWNKKEPNGLMRVKVVGVVTGQTAETVFKLIAVNEYSSKWGDAWKCQLPFEKINDWNEALYMIANTPIGVSYRDFIQWRCSWSAHDKKTHAIFFRNGAHPKYPEPLSKKNGYVRGETIGVVGYVIRTIPPTKDGTLRVAVVVITCFDLKGYIPKSIVNWAAQRIPLTWSGKLQLVCDKWNEWSKMDPAKIPKIC